MNRMPDVVDAQLRLQFLGRDVMLSSVMASDRDPAHDPSALPVDALQEELQVEASCSQHLLSATQHSEPYKSSESTSDSQAIFFDSSATRLVPKIAFCSFVNATRANLILA
jgi:hypothetical protein